MSSPALPISAESAAHPRDGTGSAIRTVLVRPAERPLHEIGSWRKALRTRLTSGWRLVTLYGRTGSPVRLTAVLQATDGALDVLRTATPADQGYEALTGEFPALQSFERELHEQTGIRLAAHPWLKPLRFEGAEQSAMDAYPFHEIRGKEVHQVAVGPVHAGVIEPGSFRFMCHGEQVHHLEIHLGYQHRGVERRLLEGDPRRLAPVVETIAGDSSVAHTWAYCAAIERLAGCPVSFEVELARAVALELERVAMHLAGLSGLAADVGFLQGATTYGRLRTTAINTTMRLCGSRFGRGALRPGGVRMQLRPEVLETASSGIALLARDLKIIDDCFTSAQTVQHRLREVGILSTTQAQALGIVGLAGRASGIDLDARQGMSGGVYGVLPIAPSRRKEGDCWARATIRIAEMHASLVWLAAALARFRAAALPPPALGRLAPDSLAIALVEGWRGEVVHCVETGPGGELLHYKVQDPSLRNWMGLAVAVRGNAISDFPICNKSFDLSYCGHDL